MTRPSHGWQRGLQFFNGHFWCPDGQTAGGGGLSGSWATGNGSATQATPGTAFDTQYQRTLYANVSAVANQELGLRRSDAPSFKYWLGNGDYLGGFYMSTVFRIEAWNNDNARIFVGMSNASTCIATADTVPNNSFGLIHATGAGQDVLSFIGVDNAGAQVTAVGSTNAVNPGILAAGSTFLFEMWEFPNSVSTVTVNFRLGQFDATNKRINKVKWNSIGAVTPSLTAMMAPQIDISNAADTTVSHFQIGVANIYCATWSGEQD